MSGNPIQPMPILAAVDEVASETQLSEGWTYLLLPPTSVNAIDAAVKGCGVTHFHGKRFKKAQALTIGRSSAPRGKNLSEPLLGAFCLTLNDLSWKNDLVPFSKRLISEAMRSTGIADSCGDFDQRALVSGLDHVTAVDNRHGSHVY